jgi:hypothetical protein
MCCFGFNMEIDAVPIITHYNTDDHHPIARPPNPLQPRSTTPSRARTVAATTPDEEHVRSCGASDDDDDDEHCHHCKKFLGLDTRQQLWLFIALITITVALGFLC